MDANKWRLLEEFQAHRSPRRTHARTRALFRPTFRLSGTVLLRLGCHKRCSALTRGHCRDAHWQRVRTISHRQQSESVMRNRLQGRKHWARRSLSTTQTFYSCRLQSRSSACAPADRHSRSRERAHAQCTTAVVHRCDRAGAHASSLRSSWSSRRVSPSAHPRRPPARRRSPAAARHLRAPHRSSTHHRRLAALWQRQPG